jgi:hypothetical protein
MTWIGATLSRLIAERETAHYFGESFAPLARLNK